MLGIVVCTGDAEKGKKLSQLSRIESNSKSLNTKNRHARATRNDQQRKDGSKGFVQKVGFELVLEGSQGSLGSQETDMKSERVLGMGDIQPVKIS